MKIQKTNAPPASLSFRFPPQGGGLRGSLAFTLVELIIVITILAILRTIGFISFSSYVSDSRDVNRITSLQEIGKGLDLYSIKSSKLPTPENPVTITASGVIIGYQGTFGNTLSQTIKMTSNPIDPLDNIGYIYSVNSDKNKFQLLTYLENQTSYNPSITKEVYAIDYTNRKIKTIGDKIGIILNTDNSPISGNVDIITTNNEYKIIYSEKEKLEGNNKILKGGIAGAGLISYYDMETKNSSGELVDLTGNGNDGVFGSEIVFTGSCINSGCIYIGNGGSNTGITTKQALDFPNELTLSVWTKILDVSYADINSNYCTTFLSSSGYYIDGINGNFTFRVRKLISNSNNFLNFAPFNGKNYLLSGENIYFNNLFEWKNLIVKMKLGKLYFYENGKNIGTQNISGKLGGFDIGNILKIAKKTTGCGGDYYLDEVRIYERALSDSEIQILYDATK